jgi:hypothetical protein
VFHIMKQMKQVKDEKVPDFYECKICYYKTCRKSQYERHLLTPKHKSETNETDLKQQDDQITETNKYVCACGKECSSRTTLWRHKKKCTGTIPDDEQTTDSQLIKYLMKENVEFKNLLLEQNKQMIELCKNNNSITNSHIMTNSNNKAFNLQFFLNETCKDAMNISEFVDSLTLQLSDLENVGKLGFVEGMSNIIIENMKLLDISKRPIHCMDTKREVMYLKDQDTWEKTSDDDNKKIRRAIKQIATKNVKNLRLFKEKHPDCINYNSKYSDQYLKLQTESCGGKHPDYENESKIIKRLAKVMAVDKNL